SYPPPAQTKQLSRDCKPYQKMRKGNLRENRDGCKLWQVNSFQYFDHTGFSEQFLGENPTDDVAMHVGKTDVSATETIRDLLILFSVWATDISASGFLGISEILNLGFEGIQRTPAMTVLKPCWIGTR